MEEINVFVRAADLDVPPQQVQPEDLYDILPRQGKALGGQATETSADASCHQHAVVTVNNTDDERAAGRSHITHTACPGAANTRGRIFTLANDSTYSQPYSESTQSTQSTESSPAKPDSKSTTPGGADAGVIVGAILLVLVGIAILAAAFLFIKKKVNGGDKPKPRAESFDFGPPARTNPNLSRAETAAMAELMRIAYRVENEGDEDRTGVGGGAGGVSYYPGVPPREKMGPSDAGVGFTTTPYEESRQADNVARMQSLGSESVAQLGLRHPVGRWVHIQKPGAVAQRTSAYDIPDMPAPNTYPDRYSTSNLYSGVAR